MKALLPLAAALLLSPLAQAKDGWLTDLAAAKKQAQAENKKILLDFTGSDWCGWCMKLDREVFSKPEFQEYAAKNLVLVELDFPRKKQLDPATKQQNEKLAAKYRIQGYPTIIITSASGQKKGELGYVEGGPAAFIKALEKAR